MDSIDYRILHILQNNARETASNISKEIHLSVSTVIERIHKLEDSGVIQRYTIVVDEKSIGNTMTALMEISLTNPRYFEAFAEAVLQMDSVVSCYYQTGEFDLLLKICCESSDELERIHRQLMSLEGVKESITHVVLKNVKNIYTALRNPVKE